MKTRAVFSCIHIFFFSVNFSQPPPAIAYQVAPVVPHQQWIREVPTVLHNVDTATTEEIPQLENPLANSHHYKIVCLQCFKLTNYPGVYSYDPCLRRCEETVLAMKPKDNSGPWVRIRDRKNHRQFPGNYILCRSVTMNSQIYCKYGEENCSFAHNEVEKFLWTLEKDGMFNILEFIMQNRKQSSSRGFSLKEIMVKYGGHFEFICRSCYYGTPPLIAFKGDGNMCKGDPPHTWSDFKIMCHFGPSGEITLINPRGFLHKTAFFKICKYLKFCQDRVNAICKFAHSMVERDVWMLERDCGISREEIVQQVHDELKKTRSRAGSSVLPIADKKSEQVSSSVVIFSFPNVRFLDLSKIWKQLQKPSLKWLQ